MRKISVFLVLICFLSLTIYANINSNAAPVQTNHFQKDYSHTYSFITGKTLTGNELSLINGGSIFGCIVSVLGLGLALYFLGGAIAAAASLFLPSLGVSLSIGSILESCF